MPARKNTCTYDSIYLSINLKKNLNKFPNLNLYLKNRKTKKKVNVSNGLLVKFHTHNFIILKLHILDV